MATRIAKEKVWRTHKNELVEDGHPEAAQLVAPRGGTITDEEHARYKNSDKFFVEEDSTEGEKVKRAPEEPKPAWTQAQIAAYRNAREGDESARTTLEKIAAPAAKKTPAAEKMRKSRPGPEHANQSSTAKKTAAKKASE